LNIDRIVSSANPKPPICQAVVLRIDSSGGSAVASDAIYREVQRTRAAGKPVVVSMGNQAASGGWGVTVDSV
jgi:protease IV